MGDLRSQKSVKSSRSVEGIEKADDVEDVSASDVSIDSEELDKTNELEEEEEEVEPGMSEPITPILAMKDLPYMTESDLDDFIRHSELDLSEEEVLYLKMKRRRMSIDEVL